MKLIMSMILFFAPVVGCMIYVMAGGTNSRVLFWLSIPAVMAFIAAYQILIENNI